MPEPAKVVSRARGFSPMDFYTLEKAVKDGKKKVELSKGPFTLKYVDKLIWYAPAKTNQLVPCGWTSLATIERQIQIFESEG